jgi:antitoxin component YwqK of YwqJK toxin-antitoxin module
MRYINAIFMLVVAISSGLAQVNDLPNMEYSVGFDDGKYEYNDTIPRNRVRTNGRPHITYRIKNDSIIREEYFENGKLKSMAYISQKIIADTSVYEDPKTGEFKLVVLKRLADLPNGPYTEYYESWRHNLIKCIGTCNDYLRVGEWTFYDQEGNKTVANFNHKGEYEGQYAEYYFDSRDSTYALKLEGQYGKREFERHYTSKKTGESESYQIQEVRRIGTWKYYSKNGHLIEEAEYKWKGN